MVPARNRVNIGPSELSMAKHEKKTAALFLPYINTKRYHSSTITGTNSRNMKLHNREKMIKYCQIYLIISSNYHYYKPTQSGQIQGISVVETQQ